MNYHNITCPDMLNGSGLRVVLWLSGCGHHCVGCQNPQTWDTKSGIKFDEKAERELLLDLEKTYISGVTLSGGDPLCESNLDDVFVLVSKVRNKYPNKTVWLYTGYTYEQILSDSKRKNIVLLCDVLVEGKYVQDLFDANYPWAGSTNQKVIDIPKSLVANEPVLYTD